MRIIQNIIKPFSYNGKKHSGGEIQKKIQTNYIKTMFILLQVYSLSSSSPSCSELIWKYLNSYESFELATTLNQSLRLCFFRYFFVKYLKYLFEKGMSLLMVILFLFFSTDTSLPKFPHLPFTLILV